MNLLPRLKTNKMCCTCMKCFAAQQNFMASSSRHSTSLQSRQVAKGHECGEIRSTTKVWGICHITVALSPKEATSAIFFSFAPDLCLLVRILLSLAMVTCPVNSLWSLLLTPAGLRHAKMHVLCTYAYKAILDELICRSKFMQAYISCIQPCPVAIVTAKNWCQLPK